MMIMSNGTATFIPTTSPVMGHSYTLKPSWRIDIEAPLHDDLIYTNFIDWTPDTAANKKTTKWGGANLVFHYPKAAAPLLSLTKTINIPSNNHYRVYARVRRGPNTNGHCNITLGSRTLKPINSYNKYYALNTIDLGTTRLNSGSLDCTVTTPKNFCIERLILKPVIKFSTDNVHGNRRLKINKADFTQNNISDMNICNFETIALPQAWPSGHYYPDNKVFKLIYEYGSPVTISMGKTSHELTPLFGGYLTRVEYNEDNNSFSFSGPDRLYDMIREPNYNNITIGAITANTNSKQYPFISLGDIYDSSEYCCETIEYPIKTDQLNRYQSLSPEINPNNFNLNFKKGVKSLNELSWNKGYKVQIHPTYGRPRPCLKVTQGTQRGTALLRLYNHPSEPVPIHHNEMFLFDYMAPNLSYTKKGDSYDSPLLFDIRLKIHRAGETISNAQYYYLPFSSLEYNTNRIHDAYEYTLDGKWQRYEVNLKELMDNYRYSSEYWLSEVAFININNHDDIYYRDIVSYKKKVKGKTRTIKANKTFNINRYMYFNNFLTTTEDAATRMNEEDNISTPFEFLQNTANNLNHSLWIDPGLERKDDRLMVLLDDATVLEEEAIEGTNIIVFDDITNEPQETICNQSSKLFNLPSGAARSRYYENPDHIIHYGPLEKYEVLSDTNSQYVAYKNAYNQVLDNLYPGWSFTVNIMGSANLISNQYMSVKSYNKPWLSGEHRIKSIEHFIDKESSNEIYSSIGCNQPSQRYRFMVQKMKNNIITESRKAKLGLNSIGKAKNTGNSSPGATV